MVGHAPARRSGRTAIALLVRADSEIHRVMGARARIGRLLEKTDRGPVAVISSQFWRERLNGDPQVLGRTVRSGEHVFTIVGVIPEEFSGMNANVSWDVTVPLDPFVEGAKSQDARARLPLDTVARLRDGVARTPGDVAAAGGGEPAAWHLRGRMARRMGPHRAGGVRQPRPLLLA